MSRGGSIHKKNISNAASGNLMNRFWWIGGFCLFCTTWYCHAASRRDAALEEVSFRLQEMEKEKLLASQEQEDLQLRLQSESDPAWVEMILMKELGVVPEGWVKVHFKK